MSESYDINAINQDVIAQFRANGGKILEGRFAGAELLLLTTKGAKTGVTRVNPLMYATPGGHIVVFASRNGGPHNPEWYHNLLAHPDVTVEIGGEKYEATAVVPEGEERQRLWAESARQYPVLDTIQAKTTRQLPVVKLERKGYR